MQLSQHEMEALLNRPEIQVEIRKAVQKAVMNKANGYPSLHEAAREGKANITSGDILILAGVTAVVTVVVWEWVKAVYNMMSPKYNIIYLPSVGLDAVTPTST